MSTISQSLSSWALGLRLVDIPSHVQHAAKRHLLDGVGNAIAARRLGAGHSAVAVGEANRAADGVPALGSELLMPFTFAALVDGVLVHALDFDDTHAGGLVHATAVTLPAAFAVGQRLQSSGAEVLTAAVAGYETVCRVAAASPHGFHARGLHATAVCGTIASAIVSARLHGATVEQAVSAVGIAASLSGGLLEFLDTGSDTKTLHAGLASMNGVLAFELAAAGGQGPQTALEGRRGLYATMSARPADARLVIDALGSRWETTQISIKPIPACQLLHVTLDAARGAPGPVDEIEQIEAFVHPDSAPTVCEPRADKNHPRTPYDAKFSLPWSLAAQLIDGQVTVDTYRDDMVARRDVATLAEKVVVHLTDDTGNAADASGSVRIRFRDGREWAGQVDSSRGTIRAPLSDEDLYAKFHQNCGIGEAATQLRTRIMSLETQPSLRAIQDLSVQIIRSEAALS